MVLDHLLLVLALVGVGLAGLRVASLLADAGLERLVCWAVVVAAMVVTESLALGLVGLGGSTAALTVLAVGTGVAALRLLPAPTVSVSGELGLWWHRLGPVERGGVGAVAGAALALAAILLHRPQPGYDGITYHIPEVVGFVQGGHPGSVLHAYYELPVGSYPLTNEVLLSWLTGISRGFAALTLWTPFCALLAVAAGWLGLRGLGVPLIVRALAICALMLGPLLVAALAQPGTDLPSLTWLICSATLCLCALRRPVLLAPALVAFGLAVGTKTTPAVIGLIVLALGFWACRDRLRSVSLPLLGGLAVAVVVGGVWYVRNFADHGSPLWPFVSAPWGDPVPESIKLVDHSMIERFRVTLLDHFHAYVTGVSGSLALLVAGALLPLAALWRRAPLAPVRRSLLAAAVVVIGAIVWADAPVTGLPDIPALGVAAGTAVRYLMPVFAAGALALALVATDGPRWARLSAVAVLAGALVWGLRSDQQNSFFLPFYSWLAVGLVLGAAVGALVSAPVFARLRTSPQVAGFAFAVLAIVVLSIGSSGFLARHALVDGEFDASAAGFLSGRPGFGSGHQPVATAPVALGPEAGDRLSHPLSVVGEHEGCGRIIARAARGWVVVRLVQPMPVPGHPGVVFPPRGTAQSCLTGLHPRFDDGSYRVYGP